MKNCIAIYHHAKVPLEETHDRIQPIMSASGVLPDLRYLSAWGRSLVHSHDYSAGAHYLTPLTSSFKTAIVLERAIPLPCSASLAAVIGEMLYQMGQGSSVFLQCNERKGEATPWISLQMLHGFLPSLKIVERPKEKKGWLELQYSRGLEADLVALQCTYNALSRNLEGFRRRFEAAGQCQAAPEESYYNSVENAFCYSMHWALQTRAIAHLVFEHFSADGPLTGLDVGGSYGFLSCELAAQGHNVVNLELLQWRITEILPWLIETSGVGRRVSGVAKRMEEMGDVGKNLDFIAFMGSLLCIAREDVSKVLHHAVTMLKPGGLILVRENLEVAERNDQKYTSMRFRAEEFDTALQSLGGEVIYYDQPGKRVPQSELPKVRTVFAAVKIPGEAI